MKRSCDFRKNS